jgi:DnaK suppressor protein
LSKSTAKNAASPKKAAKKPAKAASRTPAKKAAAQRTAGKAGKPAPKKSVPPKPAKAVAKPAPKKAAAKPGSKPPAKAAAKPVAKASPPSTKTPRKSSPSAVPVKPPKPAAVKIEAKAVSPSRTARTPTAAAAPAVARTVARAGAAAAARAPLPEPAPASRFADRFAPAKPAARVVMPEEPSRPAIKIDPRLVNAWKSKAGRDLTEPELLAMPDSEYMNEKQLEFFRNRLTALKDDLLSNAGETTEHLREDTSIVPDPADRATIEEEHALELRTRDRERKLLKKISQSLARIEAGDYGFCDETGEPIGLARLLARPTATLSLEAQQRREMKQKMFGD